MNVAFIIFNRPEQTGRVFRAIAAARPERLFVIADGPREDRPDDIAGVAEARRITETVDWPCEVHRDYADSNLGCRRRVVSGLNRVFSEVPEAVILEDDCLPDASFFPFCTELLDRYRDDPRVMHIGGDNFLPDDGRSRDSYLFTAYPHVWGWATWRRAWDRYDPNMVLQGGRTLDQLLRRRLSSREERQYWRQHFDMARAGRIDTWDYAWVHACWANDSVALIPRVNLVTNIGFGGGSTHTADGSCPLAGLPAGRLSFPLLHPATVRIKPRSDRAIFHTVYQAPFSIGQTWQAARWRLSARLRAIWRSRGGP